MSMVWIGVGTAVIGTGMSIMGQQSAAKAQAGQARVAGHSALYQGALEERLNDSDATDIDIAARREAAGIKRAAELMRAQVVQAQSGSGAMIGEGSAQAALDQIDTLSTADALAARYSGINKSVSVRASGRFSAEAGSQTNKSALQSASNTSAAANASSAGTLISGIGSAAKAYGSGTTTPKQTPLVPTTGK